MSSPVRGKFQDHYLVLGIEPQSDAETIQDAYLGLVKKFHPQTGTTPDTDKFTSITLAYEILLDTGARQAFDAVRGSPKDEAIHGFSGIAFFDLLSGESTRRLAILCLLYDRARIKPLRPGMTLRQAESVLTMSGDELRFAVGYLKLKGYITVDDKSYLQINVEGMDFLERANPVADVILPWLKGKAIAAAETPEAKPAVKPNDTAESKPEPRIEARPEPIPAPAPQPLPPTASESVAARIRTRMAATREPVPSS